MSRIWKKQDEKLLEEWADHGKVFRLLYDQARIKYRKKNIAFQVPVIILSTITGAANFATDKFPLEYRDYYSMGIGFCNIIAGIIATISTFLKVSELYEGYRASSVLWDKFYHNIKTELQKGIDDREDVSEFMKYAKTEYEKLIEQSPPLPNRVIKDFKKKVNSKKIVLHLPPVISVFDKFETAQSEVKDHVDEVLNIIGDDGEPEPPLSPLRINQELEPQPQPQHIELEVDPN